MMLVVAAALLVALARAGAPSNIYGSPSLLEANGLSVYNVDNPGSATVTAEGDIAVGTTNNRVVTIIDGSTFAVKDSSYPGSGSDVVVALHPTGNLMVIDQGTSKLSLYPTSAIPGTTLAATTPAAEVSLATCGLATAPVVQWTAPTADAAVFTLCQTTSVCKYADLLGIPSLTCATPSATHSTYGLGISPDGTFLLAWVPGETTIYKLAASDLSVVWSVDMNTLTSSTMATSISNLVKIAIRPDGTAVIGDKAGTALIDFDASGADGGSAPATVTETPVTAFCGPESTVTSLDGAGDIVLYCDEFNKFIVMDNTADFANSVTVDLSMAISPDTRDSGIVFVGDGFTIFLADSADGLAVYGTVSAPVLPTVPTPSQSATLTQTQTQSPPGSIGDPVMIDVHGHRFIAGNRGRTEYLLYESASGADRVTMTTSAVLGVESGFFVNKLKITRAGCGSLELSATEHRVGTVGPACFDQLILAGDSGMLVYSMHSQTTAVVMPHEFRNHLDTDGFLNIRFAGVTEAFKTGCRGMLCDEAHVDQLVV